MSLLVILLLWCLLLVLSPVLAVAVVLLFPVLWLAWLLIRLLLLVVEAAFALIKTLLFLPARLLGYRG